MGAQPDGLAWRSDGQLERDAVEKESNRPFSAYIHIPFCTVRCGYCDFNTYTADFGPGADRSSYSSSVVQEIALSARVLDEAGLPKRPLKSVFFGGGTPSLLEPEAIEEIVLALEENFGIEAGAEVTLEVNPETASEHRLAGFQDSGVNRVSIGMQSAVPRVLGVLDRAHSPHRVTEAIQIAKKLGLRNSLDLIYGAPTETIEEWSRSLDEAVSLDPDHLSVYSLIVEPGTKMAAMIARGDLPATDPDLDAQKYQLADSRLLEAGFSWYELSNFAKSGSDVSVHNLAYWRDWDWWGYGPGAHSHVGRLRWWNVKHPLAYAKRLSEGGSPGFEGETLTDEQRRTESVMLSMRTREGLAANICDEATLDLLLEQGLISAPHLGEGVVVLTLEGRLLADYVTRRVLGWE